MYPINTISKGGLALVLAAAALGVPLAAAEPDDGELWAGAESRIQRHRMADAVVVVRDALGRPVEGAEVRIEQKTHAFLFGCNIFLWGRLPDAGMERAYRERFAALLNYATLPFYWGSYERRRGEPRHEETERVARWCQQQGIVTKGHPLAWNNADPPWLPDDLDEIRRLQMERIEDCVRRFTGLIDRWDVVNEVTHFDRPQFVTIRAPKHSAMWERVGQIEFARQCFRHARAAGPHATLIINDYRTDAACERVIEQLVDENGRRLYDVIGIQSHMHGGVWSNAKIWEVCQRFARFGVPLHFTETTILSGQQGRGRPRSTPWRSTPEGEARQAREVVRFYTMLFSHPAVEAITWWDLSDYRAWKGAPAGLVREDMSPKPAYQRLMDLVRGKWWTKLSLQTDQQGQGRLRGFLGDYAVTVTAPGKAPVAKDFSLARRQTNRWQIVLP
ncbi:MAG TPA: 1,4-beta-xylanase [Planctomycetaceae bacterium]|nr:1,4-beta-xylanase [Planctomycetaceae bacterium]HIQ19784.1 1,4-beta-xylanase [Planctomycetota bacterium]